MNNNYLVATAPSLSSATVDASGSRHFVLIDLGELGPWSLASLAVNQKLNIRTLSLNPKYDYSTDISADEGSAIVKFLVSMVAQFGKAPLIITGSPAVTLTVQYATNNPDLKNLNIVLTAEVDPQSQSNVAVNRVSLSNSEISGISALGSPTSLNLAFTSV